MYKCFFYFFVYVSVYVPVWFLCPCVHATVHMWGLMDSFQEIDTVCCVHSRLDSERVNISLTEDIWPRGKWFVFSNVCVVWGGGT